MQSATPAKWRAFLRFCRDHPIPAVFGTLGVAWFVAVEIVDGYHLIHFASYFPPQIISAIGAVIFAASLVAILFRWDQEHRGSSPGPSLPAEPLPPSAAPASDPVPPLNLNRSIFHFGTTVEFSRLDEFLITFEFQFFNGSEYRIARDTLQGVIHLSRVGDWLRLDRPHFRESQSKTHNEPFSPFTIALEQRVTPEQASVIKDELEAGTTVSFIFGSLNLRLSSIDGADPFRVRLWDGVSCTKKADVTIFTRVINASALGRI